MRACEIYEGGTEPWCRALYSPSCMKFDKISDLKKLIFKKNLDVNVVLEEPMWENYLSEKLILKKVFMY